MNNKIKNYVDVLFSDIPRTNKAIEMKEEVLSNLNDKFDDFIKQGMSETQAYSMAVSSMGDIDEMLNEIKPDAEFIQKANKSQNKKTVVNIISVILGFFALSSVIVLGVVSELFENTFLEDIIGTSGLLGALFFGAIIAALQIWVHASVPKSHKDYKAIENNKPIMRKRNKIFEGVMSIYWSIVLLVYFLISFVFGIWNISWIIWPIAGVVSSIINTIFEMGQDDE